MATKKKAAAKKSTSITRNKMEKVMHEFKHGELKSGGRRKVSNPKQAIAIGLSEAREAGAKVPPEKGAKRTAANKTVAKRVGAKKSAAKKTARKTAGKR